MPQDLSEMFTEQQSSVIEWRGELHNIFTIEPLPERFTVEFHAARDVPVQGLSPSVEGGVLER